MEFSIFYFSGDGSTDRNDKYRLLIEGAKFADHHGFSAVWVPERHFDAFGGLYPNPSVVGAAIAMMTEHVQIRAGSVVLPLQNPLRVAEEWAVVDNLSNGRVGLSFAPGWQPNDFVLCPEKYANKKEIMWKDIEVLKQLWAGEAISLEGGDGRLVKTHTFPKPLQQQLPIWITALSDETFFEAGRIGANILTSPLYQSLEDIFRKISLYRNSWKKHHHNSSIGKVTLMVHTFIGQDLNTVREKVKKPFTDYLKTHFDLMAKSEGTSRFSIDQGTMTAQDLEDLLTYSFESYFTTKVLMGTPETCQSMIDHFNEAGVDEVAALIDFGVDFDAVMDSLHYLSAIRHDYNSRCPVTPSLS